MRTLEYAVSDDERRAELMTQMQEKTGDLEAGLADYEPFIVDQEAMETFAADPRRVRRARRERAAARRRSGRLPAFAAVQSDKLQPLLQIIADEIEAEGVAQSSQAAVRNNDAAEQAEQAELMLLVTALSAVAVAVALTVAIVRRITRTVRAVQRSAEAMADGDLTVPTGVESDDELGRMAAALDSAQGALRDVLASVVASADAVAASSEELSASSAQISASAEETSAQSGVVAGAADEVSRNVQTVAAGADQMGASIREIATNAAEASEVAGRAVTAVETTSATVSKLGRRRPRSATSSR